MTTLKSRLIPITDDRARLLLSEGQDQEPEPGSVVLINGEWGCAWQRQFDDGLWRSVRGGRGRDWGYILSKRNVVLIYDAAIRPDRQTVVDEDDRCPGHAGLLDPTKLLPCSLPYGHGAVPEVQP
jgi:hypothetical protein